MSVEIVENIFWTSCVVILLVITLAFVVTMLEDTSHKLRLSEGVKMVSGLAITLAFIIAVITGVALIWM